MRLSILLFALLLSCSNGVTTPFVEPASPATPIRDTSYPNQDWIRSLTRRLGSGDEADRVEAQKELLNTANLDDGNRRLVLKALLEVVNSQNGEIITCGPSCYREWEGAVETLGQMAAVEAIPALASRVSMNYGAYSLGIAFFPAARALVAIGDPSVPALLQVALNNPKPLNRSVAFRGIYAIHTQTALLAMEEIARKASDPNLRRDAHDALEGWEN